MSYVQLTFDRDGRLVAPERLDELKSLRARDIVFFAHGWLNDDGDAARLATYFADALAPAPLCLVRWPSAPFSRPNAQGDVRAVAGLGSYYTMKRRAGKVGAHGLARVFRALPETRIHLVGHSFGARLMTAAAGAGDSPVVETMVLLQAAFSQFAFAPGGAFRRVVSLRLVRGSILVMHSVHDWAVGNAYPIASLVGRQNASRLGDANSRWGGLGRNGAQWLTGRECVRVMLGEDDTLRSALGTPVVNLNGDHLIRSHGDIRRAEIVRAIKIGCGLPGTAPHGPQF